MAQLGIGFDKPIRHLREYLSVLMPLLEEGKVSFQGATLSCDAQVFKPAGSPPGVVVAALGPQALKVAGTRTDGTTLAWVGPKTVKGILPRQSARQQPKPDARRHGSLRPCQLSSPTTPRAFALALRKH